MATIFQADKKKKEQESIGNPSTMPISTGMTSPQTPAKGTSSGRFTNIQNYLAANKQGGQNLGNKVSSNIQDTTQKVQQGLQQQKQQFDTKANEGRLIRGQADIAAQNIINNAGQQVYGGGTQENQDVIKQFQRISSGQYLGPQNLGNVEELKSNAQNAATMGNLAGSEGGRFTLLRQMFSNPNYTKGQTKLDQLLLGGNNQPLKAARQQASTLPQSVNLADLEAKARGQAYGVEARKIGEEVNAALGTATGQSESELQNKLDTALAREKELAEAFARTQEGLKGDSISRADYDRLNLSRFFENPDNVKALEQYGLGNMGLYETNLADYLETVKSVDPTKESVATYDQAARRNALARLANEQAGLDFANIDKYRESTQKVKDDYANALSVGREELLQNRKDNPFLTQIRSAGSELNNLVNQAIEKGNIGSFSQNQVLQQSAPYTQEQYRQFQNLPQQSKDLIMNLGTQFTQAINPVYGGAGVNQNTQQFLNTILGNEQQIRTLTQQGLLPQEYNQLLDRAQTYRSAEANLGGAQRSYEQNERDILRNRDRYNALVNRILKIT